ncbi:Thioredoxin [Artemisia annua]|uniref:Thioredoxin n=1 Tax=Artemisia annua TaxID=35608 RepID=A0A2U1NE12_ARTAN|nr:Thioredoxin [Artemisia annua]
MAAIVSSSSAAATWTPTKRLTCSCLTAPSNSLGFPSTTSRRGVITLAATSRHSNDRHLGWLSSSYKQQPPRGIRTLVQAKKQTFSNLDELLEQADKPVLVDFYATWCGPCQFMGPILNEVSIALEDTIRVVKIDTEKYPEIANKYNIEALPTFILFKDGKPFDRFEGALTANQLIQRIEGTLKVEN